MKKVTAIMDVICGENQARGGGFLPFSPFRLQVQAAGRVIFMRTNCHNISSGHQGARHMLSKEEVYPLERVQGGNLCYRPISGWPTPQRL